MPTVDEKPFSGRMKAIQVQLTPSDDCLNEAHGRFGLKSFVSAPGVNVPALLRPGVLLKEPQILNFDSWSAYEAF